jgi:hypothetical protein
MFMPDPGSWFLPIPDPGSKTSNKREGWKKILFFCSPKFHKIEYYFIIFEMLKKKFWANFQKICTKLSNIWVWAEKTFSGSRGQKGTGSRIRIRNTAFQLISWTVSVRNYLTHCNGTTAQVTLMRWIFANVPPSDTSSASPASTGRHT